MPKNLKNIFIMILTIFLFIFVLSSCNEAKINVDINGGTETEKKEASFVAPTIKESLFYNGENQDLINEGRTSEGVFQYKLGTDEYSNSIPKAKDVGTYNVYYKVIGDSTHLDSKEFMLEVNIEKGNPIIVAPTAKTLTYNGLAQKLINAGTTTGGTLKYKLGTASYSEEIPEAKEIGTYNVYYKVFGDDNYNNSSENFISVVISSSETKANPVVVAPTAKTLTYNGLAQNLINAGTTTGGTLKYKVDNGTYSTDIPTATNAGTYKIYYKVDGNDYYNDVLEVSINVTISKVNPTLTAPTGKTNLIFTGTAQQLVTAGSTTLGTLKYSLDGTNYSESIPTGTVAKTYTVYYKVEGNDNVNSIAAQTISVEISGIDPSKENPTVTAPTAISNLAYTGSAQTLINAATTTGGTLKYSLDGNTYSTELPTGTVAGTYTVYYMVLGNDEYNSVTPQTITVTIAKINSSVTTAPTAKTLTYTSAAQALVNAGVASGGTLKYSLDGTNYSTTIPTGTNVSDYTVYYKVVGDENHLDTAAQSINVSISKGNHNIVAPTAISNLVYTEEAQALINAGSSTTGRILYKVGTGEYSESIPRETNVGTYTVYYKIEETANYNALEEASIQVSISIGTPVVTAPTAKTLTYTGNDQELILEGSTTLGILKYSLDGINYSTIIPTGNAVGNYTVYYKVEGTSNFNEIAAQSITVEIKEAPSGPTITSTVGSNETIVLTFNVPQGASNTDYNIYYSTVQNSFTDDPIDSELIMIDGTVATAYIVGLKSDNYYVKVENASDPTKYSVTSLIQVSAQDRSGYAHYNYTDGVGAYDDDGVLKTNAKVLYVTDDNKNDIEYDGCKGLVAILQGTHSNPIDIRIIGSIKTAQWNKVTYSEAAKSVALYEKQSEKLGGKNKTGKVYAETILDPNNNWNSYSDDLAKGITVLKGLNSYASCSLKDSGKPAEHYEWDSYWNMCDIQGKSNITIEGIGTDATIFQWGFTFAKCNSIEIKNLTFDDYTEDAIGIQGGDSSDFDYSNYWIHNCTFEEGVNNWDISYEKDKGDGDGSTDFKYAHNLTISYCVYNGTHKTNLIGANNAAKQYNITLHHNYYLNCNARLPLVRQANIHIYNNYYKGTTSTGISARAYAFAFVENNYFDGKNPFMLAYEVKDKVDPVGTTIKAIGNYFTSNTSVTDSSSNGIGIMQNGIFVLTGSGGDKAYSSDLTATRTTNAPSTSVCNPNGSYVDFDTDSTKFYYDSTKHISDVTILNEASDVPTFVLAHVGAGANYYNSLELVEEVGTKYPVTFKKYINNTEEVISAVNVLEGASVSRPSNPTLTGYEFDDWYTDNTFTEKFDFSTAITKATSIYAGFNALEQYSITYKYNVGAEDVLIDSDTYYENEETIKPSNPTLSGYKFVDWYTNTSYTTKYEFGNCLNGNITIYAKFEEKTVSSNYSISFNNSDTTSSVVKDTTIEVENGTIIAGSGGIKITAGTTTCGDFTSTKYLDLQGGGSTTNRTLKFELSTTSDITVYFGNSAGRTLNLSNGTSVVGSATTIDGVTSKVFEDVPAGTYYLYSGGSGIKIYYVLVEESSGSSTPTDTKSITMNGSSYDTIAAALAAVPTSGSDIYTILLGKGTYNEIGLSYNGSATVVISGDTDAQYGADVIIRGHGSDMTNESTRNLITFTGSGNIILENLTLESDWSRADHSGDVQAEVLGTSNTGYTAAYNCSFKSHQDTLRTTGKAWFYGCYIEGDVDFIWMESSGVVALYENCEIVSIYDTNATNHSSYVVAPRMTIGENVGKGVVIYNSTITEKNSSQTTYLARTPWSSGYYNQAAFINTTCTGVETDAWYNASITTTYPKTVIGWKMDSETAASIGYTETDDVLDSTTVINEFSGRKAILNRIYNTTSGAYKKDATGYWDIDSFITTMEWTVDADTSRDLLDGEIETEVITYNFNGSTTGIGTVYSFTGNIEKTNGTIGDIAVNATTGKFAYNTSGYTQFNATTTLTFTVTAASTITIHSFTGQHNYGVSINGGAQTAATGDDYSFDVAANDTIVITATSTSYLYNLVISGK